MSDEQPSPEESPLDLETVREAVIEELRTIFDPEIPVNIYELGLIYDVEVQQDGYVIVRMTLTSPSCPVAESLPAEVETRAKSADGVKDCEVELTWDPPWGPNRMSEAAKLQLGLM
mgnify:CR=1 FL=1